MHSLTPEYLAALRFDGTQSATLRTLGEHQGKQQLYAAQSPEVLKGLRQIAVVESTESSNRLEGVVVAPSRLKSLVIRNATPKSRSEQEIAGYRAIRSMIEVKEERDLDSLFTGGKTTALTPLHDLHLAGGSAQPIEAEVELKDFGHTQEPYRAFYGRMEGKRLAELWAAHEEHLVDRNIRRFKGTTTVNAGLTETLRQEAQHFFYFNNGVTFLCDSITEQHPCDPHRQTGTFRIRGFSIINGAQAVGAIAQKSAAHYDEHTAEVLATFVCLENAPDDFGDRVTQSRNRQNAVDLEDFAALDERQSNWQNTLRMAGIAYLVKQGEDDPSLSDTCFNAREIAPYLACIVTTNDWPNYVVAAKTDKKKLFGREGFVSARDPLRLAYGTLFADSLTARRMWRIVQIGRAVLNTVKGRSAEPDPANQPPGTLPAREILTNAGWLILHVAFIRQKALLDGAELALTDAEKQTLSREVDLLANRLVSVVQANQNWDKQARALFENKADCRTVKAGLMAALAQQNQG